MTRLLGAALILLTPLASANARADTLREYLDSAGFAPGATASGAPDLDRNLTSSAFGTDREAFTAAYYFVDELKGLSLGPLHVSSFDRRQGRWLNALAIDGELTRRAFERGGSVHSVQVTQWFILIETHATPSASFQLMLDRELKPLASFCGFNTSVMRDGSILFVECMIHFAPTHRDAE